MPSLVVLTLMATAALIDPLTLDLEMYVPLLLGKYPREMPTEVMARGAVEEYKRFLAVVKAKQSRTSQMPSVPGRMIDLVWHEHIIDTEKYAADCQRVFGRYRDHEPHDPGTPEKKEQAWAAYRQTLETYTELFGEPSQMWLKQKHPGHPNTKQMDDGCWNNGDGPLCDPPDRSDKQMDDGCWNNGDGPLCDPPDRSDALHPDHPNTKYNPVTRISAYELDLSRVRTKLNKERPNSVIGEYYRNDTIEQGLREYRDFLAGVQESPSAIPSVTELVNYVWEIHVLHTADYRRDCKQLFGSFLHHSRYQMSEVAFASGGRTWAYAIGSAW